MARITYSGLVTDIKGSIGGTTFQSNAYGFTVKNKPNMIRPNTVQQELRKLIFSKAVKDWSSITQTERDNWNTFAATFPQYAKHNPSSVLSGFAAFVKWHAAYYLGAGLAQSPDGAPVTSATPIDTATVKIINAAAVLSIDTIWNISDESWNVNYFISRPFLTTQNFVGSSPRFVKMGTSLTGSVTITNEYAALYGALPAVGQKVNVIMQLFDESAGKVLADTTATVLVTAS